MPANAIVAVPFDADAFKRDLASASGAPAETPSAQIDYLARYCKRLGVETVVREEHYIDRHFLDEHALYYCRNFNPPANSVRRFHLFARAFTDRELTDLFEQRARLPRTTIVTFLMVFLIQNTQNRDAKAIHLKLDELIRAIKGARNELIDLEEMTDGELEALAVDFRRIHAKKHSRSRSRTSASAVDAALSTDTAKADRRSSSPDRPPSSRPTSAD